MKSAYFNSATIDPPDPDTTDRDDPTGLQDPRQCDWCEHHGPDVRRVNGDDCCSTCLREQHDLLICTGCEGLMDTTDAELDGPVYCKECQRIDTESP